MAMIASVSQLKSKFTEKGATRPSVLMRKKMPSGSSELEPLQCSDLSGSQGSFSKETVASA